MTNANIVIDFIETTITGTPVLFTNKRLNKETIPKKFFYYEVSYTDDENIGYDKLAEQINNNFAGTVLSLMPLNIIGNQLYKLDKTADMTMEEDEYSSIDDFLNKYNMKEDI